MKWMISEDRLGSDQLEVIDEISKISSKPIWIQGYAGSGKSVLLLHSLKDYIAKNPNSKVCLVVFTRALVDLLSIGLRQIPFLQNKNIPVYTIYNLKSQLGLLGKFDAIFCDEVQDIPIEFISQMKQSCTHFIIAGDAAQSIYSNVPIFETPPATSNEIISIIQPLEKRLTVIYRLTKSVISVLRNVFSEMLGERPVIGSVDTEVKLYEFLSVNDEIKYCWNEAKETNQLRTNDTIAILLYSHESIITFINNILILENVPIWPRVNKGKMPDYYTLNNYLETHNISLMFIGNGIGSLDKADKENKMIIMTYHSAKGLDFDYVYLPLTGDGMWFHTNVPIDALLLVALSRSKSGLTVTYTGELYNHLKPFFKSIKSSTLPSGKTDSQEIIF